MSKLILSCDFETTVYDGQDKTEVWAAASVPLGTEDVRIDGSIEDFISYLTSLNRNVLCYFHNLKFDGTFILSWLLDQDDYSLAYVDGADEFLRDKDMPRASYKYMISSMGQWYTVTIRTKRNYLIEIRDSLKLLPFSVKKIGKDFKTKHQKLDMEYTGYRYPNCPISEEERAYIANDVLVVKEALEMMFEQGLDKLTIGSCCMADFKRMSPAIDEDDYNAHFPNLYEVKLDESYGCDNADRYIRNAYHGGWCYLVKGKENKIYHNGTTADVNSLYPSMMHSKSGNVYPVGLPHFFKGDFHYQLDKVPSPFFYIRFKCRFRIRDGFLPFLQIKHSCYYPANCCLTTSEILGLDGEPVDDPVVTLTMSHIDFYLFVKHYNVYDLVYLDGCYFHTDIGVFDEYINKWAEVKKTSKGARRAQAKLLLNNLYGKMAASTDSSFKILAKRDDDSLGAYIHNCATKAPGYIAIGAAITSYARRFTITAAQLNYHGVDNPGFVYADTDSIHCDLAPEDVEGIDVHPTEFCCWKLESCWDEAIFVRQKTYIEHVTHEDLEPIDIPYYNVKCAGMPDRCKNLFIESMSHSGIIDTRKLTSEELDFVQETRTMQDFKLGLRVPGKLLPKQIQGGTLLVNTTFEMRGDPFVY